MGVFDRIELIKDKNKSNSPIHRPEYIYQIPLTFIPGVGPKAIDKLLDQFGTEMTILHRISDDDIEAACGEKIAQSIISARDGKISISEGRWRKLRPSKTRLILILFIYYLHHNINQNEYKFI